MRKRVLRIRCVMSHRNINTEGLFRGYCTPKRSKIVFKILHFVSATLSWSHTNRRTRLMSSLPPQYLKNDSLPFISTLFLSTQFFHIDIVEGHRTRTSPDPFRFIYGIRVTGGGAERVIKIIALRGNRRN